MQNYSSRQGKVSYVTYACCNLKYKLIERLCYNFVVGDSTLELVKCCNLVLQNVSPGLERVAAVAIIQRIAVG